jgi:hypothetical protein
MEEYDDVLDVFGFTVLDIESDLPESGGPGVETMTDAPRSSAPVPRSGAHVRNEADHVSDWATQVREDGKGIG